MKEKIKSIASIAIIVGSIIVTVLRGISVFWLFHISFYSLVIIMLIWIAFYMHYKDNIDDNALIFIFAVASAYTKIAFLGYLVYYTIRLNLVDIKMMRVNQDSMNLFIPITIKAGILSLIILFVTKLLLFKIPIVSFSLIILYLFFYQKAFLQNERNFLIAAVIVSLIFNPISFIGYGIILLTDFGLLNGNYYKNK